MAHRPRVRAVAAALSTLALSAPLLTACGFNAATDRVYTPAMGANNREVSVDVLGAVIVAAEDGSGSLVATLANNSSNRAAELTSVQSTGQPVAQVEAGSVEIPARDAVNLADAGGLPTSGEFALGQYVPLTFTFSTGDGTESVDMKVAVVPNTDEFAGLGGAPTDTDTVGPPTDSETEVGAHSDADSDSE